MTSNNENILVRYSHLVDGQNKDALKAINEICDLFTNGFKDENTSDDQQSSPKKYYKHAKKILFKFLHWKNKEIQESSLASLMSLVEIQTDFPIHSLVNNENFPIQFFQDIIHELITVENDAKNLINGFKEFTEFDDVKFYLLKTLNMIIKQNKKKKEENPNFIHNFYCLLELVKLNNENNEDDSTKNLCKSENCEFKFDYIAAKKLFNSTWMEFLKFELTPSIHKRILIVLHDSVFPHLQNPLLLTDFLIDSFNSGGVVSLLALTSLFYLMQSYNLEYPDFYKKFYSLLTPDIFHAKYRARFFYLTDLFLSSTHIPEYLLAAFVKKISRLTLTLPPNVLLVLIPFLRNVLIRHKNLEKLINNSNGKELESDPFLMDEMDPGKSKAIDSSLWELQTLKSHYNPEVAIKAKFIDRQLPQMEIDLSEKYETTITDMFVEEIESRNDEIPVSFERPEGLFTQSNKKVKHFIT